MHPARPPAVVLLFASLALAALTGLGCDRAVEPFDPSEVPAQPDLERIFPEGAERAAANERAIASESPGGRPAMGARGAAGESPPPPAAPGGAAAPIRGTIALAPDLEGRSLAGTVLFLIARGSAGGPPLAVQRVPDPQLPLAFEIGPEDRMIQTLPFAGPIRITVRIDGDGDASSREPGDLAGAAAGVYNPGDDGVHVLVDQQVE